MATSVFERLYPRRRAPPIRLRDLHDTAASLALQAGVPLKVVSEQLGHSSLAITADTYTSVLPAVAHAAADAVAGIIPRTSIGSADAAALPVDYHSAGKDLPVKIGNAPRRKESPGQEGWAAWGSNPEPAD